MSNIRPEFHEIIEKHFPPDQHPYRLFERLVDKAIEPGFTVLDIGCGRTAPTLVKFKHRASRLVGIDLIPFEQQDPDLDLRTLSVSDMTGIESGSIDLCYSRSVMEHVRDMTDAYREIARVLKRGGRYVFLTPNLLDYPSLISYCVPNVLHPCLVKVTEGREEQDTFPAYYKSNTKRAIRKLAADHGLKVERLEYRGQYPNYLLFNLTLFKIGCLYERLIRRYRPLNCLQGWILCVLAKE